MDIKCFKDAYFQIIKESVDPEELMWKNNIGLGVWEGRINGKFETIYYINQFGYWEEIPAKNEQEAVEYFNEIANTSNN
jgi:hypothetical protein